MENKDKYALSLRCILTPFFKIKVLTLLVLSLWMQGKRWAAIIGMGETTKQLGN
jgi:hypothetical protein